MDEDRYPVGRFTPVAAPTDEDRRRWIDEIRAAPRALRDAVAGLEDPQLDTPYREGGWTVRQVVHHVPDSHLNAYVRFRLALTESEPTIRPYDEKRWAELDDARGAPVEISLRLLEALHERWTRLLDSLDADDWSRTLRHPENGLLDLDRMLQLYAWHGRHHVAHVTALRAREGWG
jgi:uncharacterized damage-inducible protein DinB